VLLDLLAHLDLLGVALLRVELGPQAAEVLCILALLVALARRLLARPLLVVQALAVKLGMPLCWSSVSVSGFEVRAAGDLGGEGQSAYQCTRSEAVLWWRGLAETPFRVGGTAITNHIDC